MAVTIEMPETGALRARKKRETADPPWFRNPVCRPPWKRRKEFFQRALARMVVLFTPYIQSIDHNWSHAKNRGQTFSRSEISRAYA